MHLFRYITDDDANDFGRLTPRGDLANITREEWRTKCRRRPRGGAESLRSSHAVESVGVEKRVSPQPRPRRRAMLSFRLSLPDQMTQETRKRPNGAAAAILGVRPPRTPRHDYYFVVVVRCSQIR